MNFSWGPRNTRTYYICEWQKYSLGPDNILGRPNRARRRDGFISVSAASPNTTATITTKTFIAPAGKLYINADASPSACTGVCIGPRQVLVTLLLDGGAKRVGAANVGALGGGDMLRTAVEWPTGTGPIVGKTVALEFGVASAALYSYWFADDAGY
jgi:hypothetical protein